MRSMLLLLLLLSPLGCAIAIDRALVPMPGDVVRLSGGPMHLHKARGIVTAFDGDTIGVNFNDGRVRLPIGRLDVLEVKTGTRGHTREGVFIGAVIGMIALVVESAGGNKRHRSGSDGIGSGFDAMFSEGLGILYVPIGGLLGGVAGALYRSDEWRIVHEREDSADD